MLRRFTAIGIILALVFQCTVKLGIMAYYTLNRDYIASTLCINKDKPDDCCKGKCFLSRQLEKTDNHSIPQGGRGMQEQDIPVFLLPEQQALSVAESGNPNLKEIYNSELSCGFPLSLFHPPGIPVYNAG